MKNEGEGKNTWRQESERNISNIDESMVHAGYSNTIDRVGYNGPGQKFKKLL